MYYYKNKCHRTYQNVLYIYYSSRHPSIDDGGGSAAKTPACDNYLLADEVHDGDDEKPAESGVL